MADSRAIILDGVEINPKNPRKVNPFPFGMGGASAWWSVAATGASAGGVMPPYLQNLISGGYPLGRTFSSPIPVVSVAEDVSTSTHVAADMRNPSGTGQRYGYDLASRPARGTIALAFARHGLGWSVLEAFGYQVWMRAGEWRVATAGQSTPGMDLPVSRVPLPPEGGLCILTLAWDDDLVTLAVGAGGATGAQSGTWALPTDPAARLRLRIPNGTSSSSSVGMKFIAGAMWPTYTSPEMLTSIVIPAAKDAYGVA